MLYAELFSVIQNFPIYTRNRIRARLTASLQNPPSFCNQSYVAGWGLCTILQSNTFILLLLFLESSVGNNCAFSISYVSLRRPIAEGGSNRMPSSHNNCLDTSYLHLNQWSSSHWIAQPEFHCKFCSVYMLFSKAESVSIIYTQSGYLVAALQRSVPVPTPVCQLNTGCCMLHKEQWGFQHRHGWPQVPFRLPRLSHQLFCLWGSILCQQSLIWKATVIYRQQRVLSRLSHPAQALQVSFSGNKVQLHFAGLAVQRPALVQKLLPGLCSCSWLMQPIQ